MIFSNVQNVFRHVHKAATKLFLKSFINGCKDHVQYGPNTAPMKNYLRAIFKHSPLNFPFYYLKTLLIANLDTELWEFILNFYIQILAVFTTTHFCHDFDIV